MPRKARWTESNVKDGIVEVRIFKWEYFVTYINQEMLDYSTYIWRGHRRDDWELIPTFDRLHVSHGSRDKYRRRHLEQFQYASRGRLGINPPDIQRNKENEWWAIGQHHGLATPLLDWTSSPFAAAYFAFNGIGDGQTKHRAIFALARGAVERKARAEVLIQRQKQREETLKREAAGQESNALAGALLVEDPTPEMEFIRPLSGENPRLVNQAGLFTRAQNGKSIEEWVRAKFAEESKEMVLMKLLVPNVDRIEALRMLNRMNINHLTLFPDLYGAAKFSNMAAEIQKY